MPKIKVGFSNRVPESDPRAQRLGSRGKNTAVDFQLTRYIRHFCYFLCLQKVKVDFSSPVEIELPKTNNPQ
ncbi:hypothetical protein [Flavobacterium rhizosphaerae]|uniref:Uncharacterized protein n=1 Tax=Flavobacterium rhizosphaerae TaxID=3163298 RepID=A0ABW8YY86_9FLAO